MKSRKRYTGLEYTDRRKPWLEERVMFLKRKMKIIREMELEKKKRDILAKYY